MAFTSLVFLTVMSLDLFVRLGGPLAGVAIRRETISPDHSRGLQGHENARRDAVHADAFARHLLMLPKSLDCIAARVRVRLPRIIALPLSRVVPKLTR